MLGGASGLDAEADASERSWWQRARTVLFGSIEKMRSYDPVRLPFKPPPVATLRPLPSPAMGPPRLPEPPFRRAAPTTPADRAGAHVDCFPAHTAFM
jgi:hypothetical protein